MTGWNARRVSFSLSLILGLASTRLRGASVPPLRSPTPNGIEPRLDLNFNGTLLCGFQTGPKFSLRNFDEGEDEAF
jgi:hypothetical protein